MEITFHRKKATAEDYKNLPEGAPYQLINGELVMSPAPKKTHQEILVDILSAIHQFLKKNQAGRIYPSPFDVHLDNENIFQPDICFISNENMKNFQEDGYYHGSPDLVIEILSPSNVLDDISRKLKVYEKYRVKEYFIVEPDSKDVICYSISRGKFREVYRETGIIKSEILNSEFRF